MKVQIDIENSKTQIVQSIETMLISCEENNFIFDISNITDYELSILKDAINSKLKYTDIELFFIENNKYPYFGPDYNFEIKDEKLYCYYIRDKWLKAKNRI